MIADPMAAAVIKLALDSSPDTTHSGVTAVMALEERGFRVVTVDQIRQVLSDVEQWRTIAERKQTLRAEIEAELGLRDVDPERYMEVALEAIRGMKTQSDTTQ